LTLSDGEKQLPVFSTTFELRGADEPFFSCAENVFWKIMFYMYYWSLMDSRCIFMAYGVILKHLEVDKIIWGSFSKKFRQEGWGALFLTGVENTDYLPASYI
jgi:hypothetical protein